VIIMTKPTNPAPVISEGTEPGTFTATWKDRMSGVLMIRFHGRDRASVTDVAGDGVMIGKHRYRVRITYTRGSDGIWTEDVTPGLPAVSRGMWERAPKSFDKRIRESASGFLRVVTDVYPEASLNAELERLSLEHRTATAKVRDLRSQLADAVRDERDAAEALAYAELTV
jgi:hypothetical protein